MICSLADKLSRKLALNDYIKEEEIETIAYGLFSILSKAMYFIICVLIGIFLKCYLESIVFYVSFLFIKKYAGGGHAKTEIRCFILSSISITCALFSIYFSKLFTGVSFSIIVISLISCICIILIAPIPSPEKPLSKYEMRKYKRITIIRIFILTVIAILWFVFSLKDISISVCTAIILENILLIGGKLKYFVK